ncbi:MAG: MFS transporter, partial [Methyloligellaceae bacterium]
GGVVSAFMGAAAVLMDWRIILAVLGTLGLVTSAICFFGLPTGDKRQSRSTFKSDVFQMMKSKRLNVLSLVSVPFNMGQATFYTYLTLFLREAAQASQPVAALCLALSQIAAASGRVGFAYISDTFLATRRKPMILFAVSVAMTSMIIATLVSADWNVFYLGILAFVMGGTIAGFAALMITAAVESVEPELTGSAIGYRSMAWSLGGVIGPPIFGFILDLSGSYSAAWLALAGIVGSGLLLFALKFSETRQ